MKIIGNHLKYYFSVKVIKLTYQFNCFTDVYVKGRKAIHNNFSSEPHSSHLFIRATLKCSYPSNLKKKNIIFINSLTYFELHNALTYISCIA